MSPTVEEFEVYSRLITLLQAEKWQIVCASPPAGAGPVVPGSTAVGVTATVTTPYA